MKRVTLQMEPFIEVDWEGPGWYRLDQRYDSQGQFLRWVKTSFAEGHIFASAPESLRED